MAYFLLPVISRLACQIQPTPKFCCPKIRPLNSNKSTQTRKARLMSKGSENCGQVPKSPPPKLVEIKKLPIPVTPAPCAKTKPPTCYPVKKKMFWGAKAPKKSTPLMRKLIFFGTKCAIMSSVFYYTAQEGLWGSYGDTKEFYNRLFHAVSGFLPKSSE